jgi:eukaryotic-like serine/threonine-protein kinase
VTEAAAVRTEIRKLTLPFESMRTIYEGSCEVRLYKNEITGQLQVGKRIDLLGLDKSVAAMEATLLTTIRHPNVAPVTEVAEVSGYAPPLKMIEMVMPYYSRGSIFDAMQRGERFGLAEARRLTIEALHGASEITECHGILHRDHKTPNVFIDDDGHARIGDLGVAVEMDTDGTAEAYQNAQLFSPPETFTSRRVSRRSEIYQLGLVAFELMSGPLLYDENPIDQVAARLERGRRGPRRQDLDSKPWVPKRMRSVIAKALKAKPEERFANAAEMVDALRRVKMIDWTQTVADPDHLVWEGASVQRPDRRYRVEAAQRRRGGGWRLVSGAGNASVTIRSSPTRSRPKPLRSSRASSTYRSGSELRIAVPHALPAATS